MRQSALDWTPLRRRYERARTSVLLHIDSKKLACIERAGDRVAGDRRTNGKAECFNHMALREWATGVRIAIRANELRTCRNGVAPL